METGARLRIVHIERLSDGIVVEFDDGRCVVYPVSLLLAMLPQALEITEADLEEEF